MLLMSLAGAGLPGVSTRRRTGQILLPVAEEAR